MRASPENYRLHPRLFKVGRLSLFSLNLTLRHRLEASALKLEPVPFLVEDVVADCVELLLPLVRPVFGFSFPR